VLYSKTSGLMPCLAQSRKAPTFAQPRPLWAVPYLGKR
jgi:hypothetical protein